MDLYQGNNQSFFSRHAHEVKEVIIIILLLAFLAIYKFVTPIHNLVDKPVNFTVAGISVAYSKTSTFIFQKTGIDLGFVNPLPDPEFVFQVRLASYVNENRPGPLLDIAVDARLPMDQRERALRALLKFDSSAQWIQPFLNELAKGGLPGMYDKEAPIINDLMQRIRAEGGIHQSLIRAYADSVLSFMMQHPKPVLRQHALEWVNDLIAEDAIYLLADRIDKEKDSDVQLALEEALWNVRAVSDRETALRSLKIAYARPPWPTIRPPVAYVLSRIGYEQANEQLRVVQRQGLMSPEKETALKLALSGRMFPRELSISDKLQTVIADRKKAREAQVRWALGKQMLEQRQAENQREAELAAVRQARAEERRAEKELEKQRVAERRAEEREARLAAAKEAKERQLEKEKEIALAKQAEKEARFEKARLEKARLEEDRLAEKRRKERELQIAATKQAEEKERLEKARIEEARLEEKKKKEREAQIAAAKLAEEKAQVEQARLAKEKEAQLAKAEADRKEAARVEAEKRLKEQTELAAKPAEIEEDIDFNPDAVAKPAQKLTKEEKLEVKTEFPTLDNDIGYKEPIDAERTAKKPVDLVTVKVPGSKPTTSPNKNMKGFDTMENKISDKMAVPVKIAKLPTPEEIEQEMAKRRAAVQKKAKPGQMETVNLLFEVKNQDVPLYVDPGYTKLTGVILPIGSKGQATFKVMVGEDEWYQVKSKKDTGWANSSLLTTYEMPDVQEPIEVAAPVASTGGKAGAAKTKSVLQESAYFEPVSQGVIVFEDASDQANPIGVLEEGVAYSATKSQKIGTERWFLLKLNATKSGWVHGVDVQLAGDILPPPEELTTDEPMKPGDKWVSAADDGVPVYAKASIVSKKIRTIGPGDNYKVTEMDEGSGDEWYKIKLSNGKEGWVQSMFMKVKKGNKDNKQSYNGPASQYIYAESTEKAKVMSMPRKNKTLKK